MSEAIKTENNYQAAFRALRSSNSEPSWMRLLRENAMDRFDALGFPSVEAEEWKYTNVAPITRINFTPAVLSDSELALDARRVSRFSYSEAEHNKLVFVNGALRPDLSTLTTLPDGVAAMSFVDALSIERFSEIMREHLGRVVDYNENGFTALYTALIGDGLLLLIKKDAALSAPLHLLFL